MELDYIHYMIGFQKVEMTINKEGHWHVLVDRPCRLLELKTNLCTVQNTPRKPKTSVYFNPHRCWYKRDFHETNDPPDIVRINAETFEAILAHVRFDDSGNIVQIAAWEVIKELVSADAGTPAEIRADREIVN